MLTGMRPAVWYSAVALLVFVASAYPADRITALPGYQLQQAHYAGYINVAENGRNLFYWLVESAASPATAPVVL